MMSDNGSLIIQGKQCVFATYHNDQQRSSKRVDSQASNSNLLSCHCKQHLCIGHSVSNENDRQSGIGVLTSYLLDLRIRNRNSKVLALKLFHLVEDDSSNVEVQAHTDRIRCDKNVKAVVWLIE